MSTKALTGSVIIGQSGGPSAVINASAYGVIKTALENETITKVYGAYHGIKGVLNDQLMIMDEAFAQALAQALEQTGRRIVLAFEGPEAVGFADTEVRFPFSECAPVGVIHEFYVREDARGRNVGSAMLVSLTTQFKAAGCVSVQASCARVNLKSQEFLEKRGFVKTRHAFSRLLQG